MPSPWIEVPDDWLDDDYAQDMDYQRIQRYVNMPVYPQIIDEHLLGEGKNHRNETLSVKTVKSEIDSDGRLQISGILTCHTYDKNGKMVTGGGEIQRSLDRQKGEVLFIKMLPYDFRRKPFPRGFSYLYYRKAIPLLRKLDYSTIKTHAYSDGDRHRGAAQWSIFGYSLDPDPQHNHPWSANSRIFDKFLTWLEDHRETEVTDKVKQDIQRFKKVGRMKRLYFYEYIDPKGFAHKGKDYLEGKCGKDLTKSQTVDWYGIIPDINNENTIEMAELIDTLMLQMPPKHIP
ncbi:MAG: hypothetical protein RDV48_31090 [Candidatus Eremiobacteraeota bacterium]|nr:hypothetical protein [Candidatus Eremiobacteraeota bacterium]